MTTPSRTDPGSPALWFTAWSLQGLAAGGLQAAGLASSPAGFAALGLLSGLPLLGLYLWLRRAPSPE